MSFIRYLPIGNVMMCSLHDFSFVMAERQGRQRQGACCKTFYLPSPILLCRHGVRKQAYPFLINRIRVLLVIEQTLRCCKKEERLGLRWLVGKT
jgi:hypothetical protein